MRKRFLVLGDLKIKKRFSIKKESPLDRLKSFLDELRKGGSISERYKGVLKFYRKKKKEATLKDYLLLWGVIGFVVMILIILWVMSLSLYLPKELMQKPFLSVNFSEVDFGYFGSIFDRGFGSYLKAEVVSEEEYNSTLIYLDSPFSPGVYVLDPTLSYQSKRARDVLPSLLGLFQERGLSASVISVDDIRDLPEGSSLFVLNGKPPKGASKLIIESAQRGITVFYIGGEPTEELTTSGFEGASNVWLSAGITFITRKTPTNGSLEMFEGSYAPSQGGEILPSIYFVQIGKGGIVFFPNFLDTGWSNEKAFLKDVEKVFDSFKWKASRWESVILNETAVLRTELPSVLDIESGEKWKAHYFVPLSPFDFPAYIYPKDSPYILPGEASTKLFEIRMKKEFELSKNDDVRIQLIDLGSESVLDEIFRGEVQPGVEDVFVYSSPTLSDGVYELFAKGSDFGDYAKMFFLVVTPEVVASPSVFTGSDVNVTISFLLKGSPIKVREAYITFNEKRERYENVDKVVLDLKRLLGGDLPVGEYRIRVEVPGILDEELTVKKLPSTGIGRIFSIQNIIIFLLSAIIFSFGYLFVRKEEANYIINIPDFAPIEYEEERIKTKDFLNIIEEVEKFYKWKYVPLKLSEIKSGFSLKHIKGRKLNVTTFNLEFLLGKLIERGLVKEELGYYGLTEWEKRSKMTMVQLALYRKVRDICVLNVIPFTSRLSLSKGYHTRIKISWNDVYLYYFDTDPKVVKFIIDNVPLYANKGLVFILFKDDEAKRIFLDLVRNDHEQSSILEFLIKAGNVYLLTIDEFEEKVKSMGR